jgi:ADP-ribose pyrophosphatase
VRQFRYPVGEVFLEFPAGKIDPPESALVTARRELTEETGYTAATLTPLGRIHSVVGYSDEAIDLFVAQGLTFVGARPDVGEFLEIVTFEADTMLAALDRGEITDAKTVAALLLYVRWRPR